MIKRLLIAIVLLALVGGGIVGFNLFRDKMIAQFFAGMTPPPVAVSVTPAKAVTWQPGIETIGTALASQGTDLAAEAAGIVREIKFSANDSVEKGQLLVQIDDRQERADLAAAQAGLELAQTALTRAQALRDRGVSAVSALDEATAASSEANATVEKLRAALETKQLTAPFSGTVGIPQVEAGQFVTAGTTYATLQNQTEMRVDFTLSEQQAAQAHAGMPVQIYSEDGALELSGAITGIEPKIDPNSRLVTLRAEIPNDDGDLTPGQFVRVRVILPTESGVIALPQTAVASSLYGDSVYVVTEETPDGADEPKMIARQVFVTLGRRSGGMIEIVKGVSDGDQVVDAGQNRLSPGATVKIDNSLQLTPEIGASISEPMTETPDDAPSEPASDAATAPKP
ncbi:efflux transporter periplasmic adaptor subunit [Thioclava sp. SK-1]|uniref:efflux RND transporter periplasmic adaptor subunit n=1 Tax=Thioclava sp. SK-1 TaxID=1889770 RepID=UPI0008269A8C|nr:efflux RND transporter periplasmic adaptor subunit [Thioclava sp. SK-1]OCX65938.1 efflux transporter periplasmic adaptor subunit [Thioclava sp. SK-1]